MVFKSSNSSDNWLIKSSCNNFIGYFYFKRADLLAKSKEYHYLLDDIEKQREEIIVKKKEFK